MPTHRDHPWERDARAAARDGAASARDDAAQAARRRLTSGPQRPSAGPSPCGSMSQRRLKPPEIVLGFLVAFVGIALAIGGELSVPAPVNGPLHLGSRPEVKSPSIAVARVEALHSRFTGPARVEIWGEVHQPDGTTVRAELRAGSARHVVRAPVASGRFYALVTLPRTLRGQRLAIRARVLD